MVVIIFSSFYLYHFLEGDGIGRCRIADDDFCYFYFFLFLIILKVGGEDIFFVFFLSLILGGSSMQVFEIFSLIVFAFIIF